MKSVAVKWLCSAIYSNAGGRCTLFDITWDGIITMIEFKKTNHREYRILHNLYWHLNLNFLEILGSYKMIFLPFFFFFYIILKCDWTSVLSNVICFDNAGEISGCVLHISKSLFKMLMVFTEIWASKPSYSQKVCTKFIFTENKK